MLRDKLQGNVARINGQIAKWNDTNSKVVNPYLRTAARHKLQNYHNYDIVLYIIVRMMITAVIILMTSLIMLMILMP